MSFVAELKRRNVVRAGLLYVVAAWLTLQVADVLFGALDLPDWSLRLVLGLLVLGLPLTLIFSWVYELTPEGLKREHEVDRNQSITAETGRKINLLIVVLLALSMGMLAADRLWPRQSASVAATPTAVDAPPAKPAAAPASPAADAASIAVLPFVNMSDDPANEYFSDGLSEEVLNVLAQIPDLRVIARTSSFAFKGEKTDIATVAAKLAVAHVLEGSVRKAGNRVRITAQLIRASDSSHLWSQSYDRALEDVFAVQDEIAREVAAQLERKLLPRGDGNLLIGGTDNAQAHDLFLRVSEATPAATPEGMRQRLGQVDEVLALDPGFARAHLLRASILRALVSNGWMPPAEGRPLTDAALVRAIELAPDLADAYAVRSRVEIHRLDWRNVEADLRRALALNPGSARVQSAVAFARVTQGRHDEAIQAARIGQSLDPIASRARFDLAFALHAARRNDEARMLLAAIAAADPTRPNIHYFIGEQWLRAGDPQRALAAFAKEPVEWRRHIGNALAYDAAGQREEADRAFDALLGTGDPDWSAFQQAQFYAQRGDTAKAIAALETGLRVGDPALSQIKFDSFLDPLRGDPRFDQLVARMKIPP